MSSTRRQSSHAQVAGNCGRSAKAADDADGALSM